MPIKKPVKKEVLKRDNYRCRKCGSKEDLTLHHTIPQRLDGPDTRNFLVCLCRKCHTDWHSLEDELGIGYSYRLVKDTFFLWLKNQKIKLKPRVKV